MAAPTIPPRPSRSQNMPAASATIDVPQVPARPRRSVERSVSPNRDRFAPSPLNNPAYLHKVPSSDKHGSGLAKEVPARPPSVTLPSVGQEGSEYDHATPVLQADEADAVATTSNTADDLPLHAPKASLPVAAAKQRIAAVTRTDSSQAAALGIGKAHSNASDTDVGVDLDRSSSRQSQTRSRPPSLYRQDTNEHEEHGIPVIGLQVPMYPNAGDVQAPTPSPGLAGPGQGAGFHSSGGQGTPRHHSRTKSGREIFYGPPGSYGLHGHGINKADPFEKAWYERHPEALAREQKGEYGPAISEERKEWALSSDELNKLVHTTSHPGVGSSPAIVGTPGEDVGYIASEEYAQRLASRPNSTKPRRPSSQTFAESPLRKMSFPTDALESAVKQINHSKHDHALDSEVEDDTIHVDIPRSPYVGAARSVDGHADSGDDIPILAADEAAYRPDAQYMQPAVEPEFERRSTTYLELSDGTSHAHSRSNSINKISEHQLAHIAGRGETLRPESVGTPLEDVKEYEPLFDDDDEPRADSAPATVGGAQNKSNTKRPDLARHHFPSRDVWEDAPDSLNYVTTVEAPQDVEESHPAAEHEPKGVYEPPADEQARKTAEKNDQEKLLPDQMKRLSGEVAAGAASRPPVQPRFPSKDIWEDTPSSQLYTTTIDPEDEEVTSPVETKQPQVPARPARKAAEPSSDEPRQVPVVPARPKPSVPARPSRFRGSDASEEASLAKSTSRDSNEGGASVPKSKPAVPVRPGGSGKIAALQAGFMSDLNKKLGLGPQAPKKEEPKVEDEPAEEKAPLADARKGRARGPQRRRPGVSPSGAGGDSGPMSAPSRPVFKFTISRPQTIWEVDEGVLSVPVSAPTLETAQAVAEAAKNGTPAEIHISSEEKAAGEPLPATVAGTAVEDTPLENSASKDPAESTETAVQTGETTLHSTDAATGEVTKATAYVGGKAPEEGNVVVTDDGKEHISAS
ncbi:uncharacterized protein PV09_01230 [Verruconis gallopava]|uniref:Altered inheritance of mitochondria protein 21 n=1 Tax=Verruconis gallopava TaxID=253628 RepID=A0A0D1XZS5_9PEZI|nr:uncharacterized protein PV09_01230 [Verruconis gallopava]KIW08311.1 hypothetical protein PV09_01230 [Verruconis gallopava]